MPLPRTIRRTATAILAGAAACTLSAGLSLPASATPSDGDDAITIADPQATESTRALYQLLNDYSATGRTLFGHQQDLNNHVTDDDQNQGTGSDVYALTGQYPGLMAQDTGTEPDAEALATDIIDADAVGAVMTLSSHWNNPATGGNFNDTTAVVDRLLPGGDLNGTFDDMLDIVADAVSNAKRADGTLIPVIYRPLHENDGSWFWWGAGHATSGEYIELYRYIVEYLRDVRGVHNLLYAYCGYTMDAYPGDDYVDIIGTDPYDNATTLDDSRAWIRQTVERIETVAGWAEEHGKIVALTEFGKLMHQNDADNVNPHWFTELLSAIKASPTASRIAYMMTWANWGVDQCWTPWPGTTIADDFIDYVNDDSIVMASGAPLDYTTDVQTTPTAPSVRIVTPTTRARVDGTVTVYARVSNATAGTVTFTVDDDAERHELTPNGNGYHVGDWAIDGTLAEGRLHTLHVNAETDQGVLSSQTTVIIGAQPARENGVIDDFDHYADDIDLRQTWTPNNMQASAYQLTDAGTNGSALTVNWDFNASPGYLGLGRGFPSGEDWSGFDAMQLYVKTAANGHKFVVQLTASGVTFEAYPSLNDDVDATLRLPFAQFTPASWESDEHKTMTLTPDLLTNVTAFSLYLNDGDTEFTDAWSGGDRPRSGQITIDSIRCVDTTAETARDEARAQLAETIAEAVRLTKDDYTTDSWEAFADALTQADAVLADADATLDELTAARTALVDTTNGLVKKPGDSGTGDIDPGTKPDTAPQVNGKEPAGTTASTGSATLVIAAAALALMLAGAGVLAIRRHRS